MIPLIYPFTKRGCRMNGVVMLSRAFDDSSPERGNSGDFAGGLES